MKKDIYIVIDELSSLGNKAFFDFDKARAYSLKCIKRFKAKLAKNPYMSKKDIDAPIIEDEDIQGDYHYHGSHTWIEFATIEL